MLSHVKSNGAPVDIDGPGCLTHLQHWPLDLMLQNYGHLNTIVRSAHVTTGQPTHHNERRESGGAAAPCGRGHHAQQLPRGRTSHDSSSRAPLPPLHRAPGLQSVQGGPVGAGAQPHRAVPGLPGSPQAAARQAADYRPAGTWDRTDAARRSQQQQVQGRAGKQAGVPVSEAVLRILEAAALNQSARRSSQEAGHYSSPIELQQRDSDSALPSSRHVPFDSLRAMFAPRPRSPARDTHGQLHRASDLDMPVPRSLLEALHKLGQREQVCALRTHERSANHRTVHYGDGASVNHNAGHPATEAPRRVSMDAQRRRCSGEGALQNACCDRETLLGKRSARDTEFPHESFLAQVAQQRPLKAPRSLAHSQQAASMHHEGSSPQQSHDIHARHPSQHQHVQQFTSCPAGVPISRESSRWSMQQDADVRQQQLLQRQQAQQQQVHQRSRGVPASQQWQQGVAGGSAGSSSSTHWQPKALSAIQQICHSQPSATVHCAVCRSALSQALEAGCSGPIVCPSCCTNRPTEALRAASKPKPLPPLSAAAAVTCGPSPDLAVALAHRRHNDSLGAAIGQWPLSPRQHRAAPSATAAIGSQQNVGPPVVGRDEQHRSSFDGRSQAALHADLNAPGSQQGGSLFAARTKPLPSLPSCYRSDRPKPVVEDAAMLSSMHAHEAPQRERDNKPAEQARAGRPRRRSHSGGEPLKLYKQERGAKMDILAAAAAYVAAEDRAQRATSAAVNAQSISQGYHVEHVVPPKAASPAVNAPSRTSQWDALEDPGHRVGHHGTPGASKNSCALCGAAGPSEAWRDGGRHCPDCSSLVSGAAQRGYDADLLLSQLLRGHQLSTLQQGLSAPTIVVPKPPVSGPHGPASVPPPHASSATPATASGSAAAQPKAPRTGVQAASEPLPAYQPATAIPGLLSTSHGSRQERPASRLTHSSLQELLKSGTPGPTPGPAPTLDGSKACMGPDTNWGDVNACGPVERTTSDLALLHAKQVSAIAFQMLEQARAERAPLQYVQHSGAFC